MSLKAETATKDDINSLHTRISAETKIAISEAVDPLKDEMEEVRGRLRVLESRPSSSGGLSKQQIQMINSIDPANRQVAFSGFSASTSLQDRVREIE
eukprot:8505685-Pyramimonas_sp.AAC.1